MPFLNRPDGSKIYYEVRGTGIPVLFIAPGGFDSCIDMWHLGAKNPNSMKFYNPVNPAQLPEDKFQKILMDQRGGAGKSEGPIATSWKTYTQDQLALLDHLGIHKCLTIGSCIGPSYQFALMEEAPERFPASVLIQPVGLAKHMPHNTPVTMLTPEVEKWEGLNTKGGLEAGFGVDSTDGHFFGWAKAQKEKKGESDEKIRTLHDAMFKGRRFVYTVDEGFVQNLQAPLLVLMGMDAPHPTVIAKQIALLAPNATLIEDWKRSEVVPQTMKAVTEFMLKHGGTCTPAKL